MPVTLLRVLLGLICYLIESFAGAEGSSTQTQQSPGGQEPGSLGVRSGLSHQLTEDLVP